jgi:ElaB/YqjD/DUF883 family membrane-anchored ribosome-binding protein
MARATRDQVTVDKLMQDLQTVVADAEALLRATASQAGEKVQEARAKAAESLSAARERLNEMKDGALDQAREIVDTGEEYVRENPWKALGLAAAAGVLIGLLLRRR